MSNDFAGRRTRSARCRGMISAFALCFLMMMSSMAHAIPGFMATYNGDTTGNPTFARPEDNGNDAPTQTAIAGGLFAYHVKAIQIAVAGSYTFSSTAGYDNYTVLYANSFDPAAPLTNALIANDDLPRQSNTSGFTITLQPGIYQFVNTGYSAEDVGPFNTYISGPGEIQFPDNFTVTNTNDGGSLDGICTAANVGDGCSLREAINLANAGPNTSTVDFAPVLGGSTVSLSTEDDNIVGPTALIITTPITINGLAAATTEGGITIARDTEVANLRLFRVTSTGSLTLRNLTVAGGTSVGSNGGDAGSGGGGGAGLGGAILVGGGAAGGTLTVENCTFSGNRATGGTGGVGGVGVDFNGGNGGGVGGSGNGGGAGGAGGNGPIGGNGTSGSFGGGGGGGGTGISNAGAIGGNGGNGGFGGGGGAAGLGVNFPFGGGTNGTSGVGGVGGGNGAAGGGGGGGGLGSAILNYGGAVTLVNSTFANNVAVGGAGGFDISGSRFGGSGIGLGAVFNGYGTLNVSSCTFSGNTANGGGAIFNNGDGMGNAAVLTLNNSILANSFNDNDAAISDYNAATSNGTQSSSGTNNLIESNIVFIENNINFDGTGTVTGDPQLAALAENGGPTQTFALLEGSPAYNAGSDTAAAGLTTDQRGAGFARIVGSTVDIGSYESAPFNIAPVAVGPDSLTTGQNVAKTVTLVGEDADTTDTLAYIITSLPTSGTLYDGADTTTAIAEAPYTLTDAQHRVTFRSSALGQDSFAFKVNDGTIDSADKTVTTTVTDVAAPTVAITVPADKSIVTSLASISGTAGDNVGIVRVDLYLQRQNDKKFWNGESWTAFGEGSTLSTTLTPVNNGVGRVAAGKTQPRSINAAPDVTWTASSPLPGSSALQSGPYFIAARAVDVQGNGTSTSALINVDVLAPVIVIGSPAASAAVATTPVINGIASDTQGGSGLDRVTLVLRRNGFGDYWNGTNWAGTTPVAFNATLTGTSWKRDGGLPVIATADATKKLTDGGYTVTAVAYDRAGNLSTIPTRNFTVDTKKPVVAISTPANNANVSTLPSVSGTASDVGNGSGVATVALYLQRKSDNKYWNGTSWVAPVSALTTTLSGTTWTRNSGLPSGADLSIGNYFLAARATDRAGNGESAISNFRVVAGSSTAQTTASPIQLSTASAKADGTISLTFTGALGASAGDASNYAVNNGAIAIETVSQPDASTVEIKASALSSGARIAVAYNVQDAQGRSLKGSANVVVK